MTAETTPAAQGRLAGVAHASIAAEQVLARLQSASALCHCIPGAKSVEPSATGAFVIRIEGTVGPFEARIDGTLSMNMDPEGRSCRLCANGGSGSDSHGEIEVGLAFDAEENGCRLVYDGAIAVTGGAAAMGDRIVETVANMLARLFFERLTEPAAPVTDPAADPATDPVVTPTADPPGDESPDPPRLGLNPQVWVPGLCVALLMLVLVFRL